jgi:hypothetical protein
MAYMGDAIRSVVADSLKPGMPEAFGKLIESA